MPTTRKKIIKTVYKDEEESENEGCDFSDSGSEAVITDQSSSDDDDEADKHSSEDDFQTKKPKSKQVNSRSSNKKEDVVNLMKTNFAKSFKRKNKRKEVDDGLNDEINEDAPLISVKDLTDADKLLPMLNLSESDSSDDETPRDTKKNNLLSTTAVKTKDSDDEEDTPTEYKDVWSNNLQDNSEEIAKKAFMELEQHKNKIEETKMSIQNYTAKNDNIDVSDIKDLLALGEEEVLEDTPNKKKKKIKKQDSDSEVEDWEEVVETKGIPQQGLQLIVDIPHASRKSKKLDVEMMMKRKINRVKKEYQVYMHKVHVLCWLGHGNYVSQVLNDQTLLAAALALVPSNECYPGERVDIKYLEQITTWFKDKMTLQQDKSENKFKPKAPLLKDLLLKQLKSRVFTTKKYMVFVFVSMLRSLGLQCRVMFNFVTLPIKPPSSELCSLSTKGKDDKNEKIKVEESKEESKTTNKSTKISNNKNDKIPQLDGNYDSTDDENITQLDGNDDGLMVKTRRQKSIATKSTQKHLNNELNNDEESVSPPKRSRRNLSTKAEKGDDNKSPSKSQKDKTSLKATKTSTSEKPNININKTSKKNVNTRKSLSLNSVPVQNTKELNSDEQIKALSTSTKPVKNQVSPRKTRSSRSSTKVNSLTTISSSPQSINKLEKGKKISEKLPKIVVTNENNDNISSKYFESSSNQESALGRKRSRTSEPKTSKGEVDQLNVKKKRTKSAHSSTESKYFISDANKETVTKSRVSKKVNTAIKVDTASEDKKRVSHKDLAKKKAITKNDVTNDLVNIIKGRVKEAKVEAQKGIVKGKIKQEESDDSDFLPVESPKTKAESDDDFKPTKTTPKPKLKAKKIDRSVVSTDDDLPLHKIDVWCEVFVEELEEWVPVDVIKGQVHCLNEIYNRATHPVTYIVGWDNNNYLKDLTRRYVPHWNTFTRKLRVEPLWWDTAIKPWLGPKTARDREEDERLDRMQLEAPLPKIISEYKNHPLYALKRHLLKFEAIYPPDAAVLGFVRGEAVYARECVYVCRSREIWLKEAKVVKLGEQPYKIVKARPKWDKLSNKLITDKPLEIFGPWQVQDYEPPTAENGIVPRNPYGNVELFKECMLPKGTVVIKLPGLNRIAKKLNIDCAPAMTGFDYSGGYCHPVYDGFVVCEEFKDIITEAWVEDQEEQERKEQEKTEARVYGNWRRLIRGLLIKQRLKAKYGFEEPSTSQDTKKTKGPRLVVKKK